MIIESIKHAIIPLIQLAFLLWGIGMMIMRVCSLPFIIRSTTEKDSTEALSLSASTWSLSTIFSGLIIFGLDWVSHSIVLKNKFLIDEYSTLWVITIIGMSSYFFAKRIDEDIANSKRKKKRNIFSA